MEDKIKVLDLDGSEYLPHEDIFLISDLSEEKDNYGYIPYYTESQIREEHINDVSIIWCLSQTKHRIQIFKREHIWVVFDTANGDRETRRYLWWFKHKKDAWDWIHDHVKDSRGYDVSVPIKRYLKFFK